MPNLTISKAITYTDLNSGLNFPIAASKTKKATHAYQQIMTAADGIQRNILEIATDPSYTNLRGGHFENVGDVDAFLIVTSGGTSSWSRLPPGRTFEIFNLNYWNQDSATDPDTIDTIQIQGNGGTCRIKVAAFFS